MSVLSRRRSPSRPEVRGHSLHSSRAPNTRWSAIDPSYKWTNESTHFCWAAIAGVVVEDGDETSCPFPNKLKCIVIHLRSFTLLALSPTPCLGTTRPMSTEASSSRRRGDESDDERLPTSSSSIPSTSQSIPQQQGQASGGGAGEEDAEAAEIAAMKARVAEMEAEAAKLRELTAASEAASQGASNGGEGDVNMSDEDREATDSRSVYVGNVSYLSLSLSLHRNQRLNIALYIGWLRCDTRRDSTTLCFMWYYQPSDNLVRQVHGTQRVCPKSVLFFRCTAQTDPIRHNRQIRLRRICWTQSRRSGCSSQRINVPRSITQSDAETNKFTRNVSSWTR